MVVLLFWLVSGYSGESYMKSFWRVFKYVWPQWPRVAVVCVTATVVAILFAMSFMTIGPLLKVMMNEEGMHGWVNRKICNWRYGLDFYVPDKVDFAKSSDMPFYLDVTRVDEDEPAEAAGIEARDKIFDVGGSLDSSQIENVPSDVLLEKLAIADGEAEITITVKRDNQQGVAQLKEINLITPVKRDYVGQIQWLMSFVPKGEDKSQRERTVIYIILIMAVITTVRCIATFYQKYLAEKVVQVSIARLREDAFQHVMHMPIGFFSTQGTSDTTSRIIGDTAVTGKGVKVLLGKCFVNRKKPCGHWFVRC